MPSRQQATDPVGELGKHRRAHQRGAYDYDLRLPRQRL